MSNPMFYAVLSANIAYESVYSEMTKNFNTHYSIRIYYILVLSYSDLMKTFLKLFYTFLHLVLT